ncbi:hypothetical protein BDW02DRAFT_572658 [Decorospora gaudefroyi]|uniref:Uncharacterized protein n=1 Tax=Decorospora gaudefroyi TaxID=184978 RepID=A0A6A5K865_9PLEO|nr:hypothetical protein BDW02DRAFT_572658 [Decorospora gaudefroyi]
MANSESRPLGQQALRAFGIFHVITALPAMVILGFYAWEELMWPYAGFYHFL